LFGGSALQLDLRQLLLKQWHNNTGNNPNNPDPDFWVLEDSRIADQMTHAWLAVTQLDEDGNQEILAQREEAKQRCVAAE
tara:strand:- start:4324 stop:4563 length:240 start_codon:yes stop_codon:yes gene_type:complete